MGNFYFGLILLFVFAILNIFNIGNAYHLRLLLLVVINLLIAIYLEIKK